MKIELPDHEAVVDVDVVAEAEVSVVADVEVSVVDDEVTEKKVVKVKPLKEVNKKVVLKDKKLQLNKGLRAGIRYINAAGEETN